MTHGLCAILCVQWQVTVREGAGQGRVDLMGQLSNPSSHACEGGQTLKMVTEGTNLRLVSPTAPDATRSVQ
jgi:hypothetical protein